MRVPLGTRPATRVDAHAPEGARRRRTAWLHGPPYRAPGRAAGHHRGDARRSLGDARALDRGRLPRRVALARGSDALPRAPAVQGHRAAYGARHLRRARRGRAASSTPSPARSTPATTRGCSTPMCRWRSTSSATWSTSSLMPDARGRERAQRDPRRDRDARRRPRRRRPRRVRRRRCTATPPLGRPITGIGRLDQRAHRAGRSPATTAAATPPTASSSRPRAASTTPTSSGWCSRPSRRPARSATPTRGPAGSASAAREPHRTATTRRGRAADRAGQLRARRAGLRAQRPAPVRARRRSTPRSAAARRAGCSRRSASAAASPTRSTRSRSQYVDGGYFAVARRLHARPHLRRARHLPRRAGEGRRRRASRSRSSQRGKGQLRGGLVMGLEDSSARMTRIGKSELVPGGLLEHRRDARAGSTP